MGVWMLLFAMFFAAFCFCNAQNSTRVQQNKKYIKEMPNYPKRMTSLNGDVAKRMDQFTKQFPIARNSVPCGARCGAKSVSTRACQTDFG